MSHSDSSSLLSQFVGSVDVRFRPSLSDGAYKLLEVTESMLNEISQSYLNSNTREMRDLVELRGSNTDEAVLVTANKTYSVRLVESSNTQLLVQATPTNMFETTTADNDQTKKDETDKSSSSSTTTSLPSSSVTTRPLDDSTSDTNPSPLKKQKVSSSDLPSSSSSPSSSSPDDVGLPIRWIEGIVAHHYEVSEILPRIHVLRELLMKRMYSEKDEEENDEEEGNGESGEGVDVDMTTSGSSSSPLAPLYTFSSLRRLIQASDVELRKALSDLDAFEDGHGRWRVLDPDYVAKVFDSLMNLFIENQWTHTSQVPLDQCEEGLKVLYPKMVTRQVVNMHSKKVKEGEDQNCEETKRVGRGNNNS